MPFKKIKLLTLLLFLFFGIAQSQDLNIPIKMHAGFGPFLSTSFNITWYDSLGIFKNSFPSLKNIPDLKNLKRGIIIFQHSQFFYQNYIAENISDSEYLEIQKDYKWIPDEKMLSKKTIKCYVNVFKGKNNIGQTVCVLDINNNYDLSDDTAFVPLQDNSYPELNEKALQKIYCERFINKTIVKDSVSVLIVRDEDNLNYNIAEYGTGMVMVGHKKYSVLVRPNYFVTRNFSNCDMIVLPNNQIRDIPENSLIQYGRIITLNNVVYKNNGVDILTGKLRLKKLPDSNIVAPNVGFLAPEFAGIDILSKDSISSKKYKGKYLFIDFWGTWCSPCRAEIPELKKAYESIDKNEVEFVGIMSAENSKKDLGAFLIKNGINWKQIYSDVATLLFRVNTFPTKFLIDPSGKIIASINKHENFAEEINALIKKK